MANGGPFFELETLAQPELESRLISFITRSPLLVRLYEPLTINSRNSCLEVHHAVFWS